MNLPRIVIAFTLSAFLPCAAFAVPSVQMAAPNDATYITQTDNSTLANEQALSALATGLVKVANGTGVLSTAVAGTDYIGGSTGATDNAVLRADGTGGATMQDSLATVSDTGSISVPTSEGIGWNGQSQLFNSGDGIVRLSNAAGSGFTRLQLGGTSGSFPAIRPSGIAIDVVTADNLNWAPIRALSVTLNDQTMLVSDAANTLAQRNGANAQELRIYEAFTDTVNYERLRIFTGSNVATIATDTAGTGSDDLDLTFSASGNGNTISTTPFLSSRRVINDADGGTLTATDVRGQIYTNTGSVITRTFNLPPAAAGMHVTFLLSDAVDLIINPDNADRILGLTNATGDAISNSGVQGNGIVLVAVDSTNWIAISIVGTWSDAN